MSIEKKLYVLKLVGEYDYVEKPCNRRHRYYRYEEEKFFFMSHDKVSFEEMVALYKKVFPKHDFREEVYVLDG